MRVTSFISRLAVLSLSLLVVATAGAAEEAQLVESINAYRSQVQRCAGQASAELPPLAADPRLILPATGSADLQGSLARASYPMVNVQAISLSGPRDARASWRGRRSPSRRRIATPCDRNTT